MAFSPAPTADADADVLTDSLAEARERTFTLVSGVSDCDLERVYSTLMSPLVWDLGHIAAFEDLWLVHRFGGEDMVRRDLAEVYDAFETPRAERGDLPFLGPDDARDYLAEVRERALAATERLGPGDGTLHELVIRHENQHNETMLQAIELARLDCFDPAGRREMPAGRGGHTGLELVDVPGGECDVGAPAAGFAYDNERPRHRVELESFRIGLTPVTNATFLSFTEGGGYERREWWTDEAWHWKEEYDITGPLHWSGDGHEWVAGEWRPLDPDKPVVHVSWFEADAFARAQEARLPTEFEWERAATWDQETGRALRAPWGDEPWSPDRANLDHLAFGTAPVGAHPDGASPSGCLDMLGNVWEWTASHFRGYPGFAPHPYKEYSEVFFGNEYRVLRGGSWASRPRVATPTFRNWDYPDRRQIFSGLRIARDT
jgi:gamma-glutamyl hercynylcysteine S-oxide synthase